MCLFHLVHCPPDPRLVGDEGRADGIPADQADDVCRDILVGFKRSSELIILRNFKTIVVYPVLSLEPSYDLFKIIMF